ncbi:MAG: hypothetical protein IKR27_06655 [Lachnospiraceae bacterium]|nr:hypothetical protein [Lachnospiraceae bacterium]
MDEKRKAKVLRVAVTEWAKWVKNPRMLLLILFYIVTKSIVIEPLLSKSARMGGKMNMLEPMVAVGNSWITVMLLPAVFLIIISDFPVIEDNTMLYVSRVGRRKWFFGQVFFAFCAVLTYLLTFFLIMFISGIRQFGFSMEWSTVTKTYLSRFPEASSSFAYRLLPSNLYNQMSLKSTFLLTFFLLFMYLFTLTMILLFFTAAGIRGGGIPSAYLVVFLGVATHYMPGKIGWAMPFNHSIVWTHYEEIVRKPKVPISTSAIYFALISLILIIAGAVLVRKMDFSRRPN